MRVGIFIRTYKGLELQDALSSMRKDHIKYGQFNMSCVGQNTMPDFFSDKVVQYISNCVNENEIVLDGISGTFNILKASSNDFVKFENLAKIASSLGIKIITVCTGSMSNNMWEYHPDNSTAEAWNIMSSSLEKMLEIANKYNLIIGIEPEASNVISNADKAYQLMKQYEGKNIGIVFDAANLLPNTDLSKQEDTLKHAFDLLGEYIISAHAKDYDPNLKFVCAGKGKLNYDLYIDLLKKYNYKGTLMLHQLDITQIEESVAFIVKLIEE